MRLERSSSLWTEDGAVARVEGDAEASFLLHTLVPFSLVSTRSAPLPIRTHPVPTALLPGEVRG